MPSNDFLPFAAASGANVLTQAQYAALSALTSGFGSGPASSAQLNKVWRQSSIMAAVLGQYIADYASQNANDDGTIAALEANLVNAVRATARYQPFLTDSGSGNAYAASNPVPLTTSSLQFGVTQYLGITRANTGPATYAPDGLVARPIVGMGGQPLQGGELVVNGTVVLVYLGNWYLFSNYGGSLTIAAGSKSQHAVNLSQFAFTQSGTPGVGGYQKLPSGWIIQWAAATTNASGSCTVTYPIAFPQICVQIVGSYSGGLVAYSTAMGAVGASSAVAYVSNASGGAVNNATVSFIMMGY